jgi:hypothetical protein
MMAETELVLKLGEGNFEGVVSTKQFNESNEQA